MTGIIYFVRCTKWNGCGRDRDGLVKIGYTSQPLELRLSNLIPTYGEMAVLGVTTGDYVKEAQLHAQHSQYRVSSQSRYDEIAYHEWFYPHPDLLAWIEQNTTKWQKPPKRAGGRKPLEYYRWTPERQERWHQERLQAIENKRMTAQVANEAAKEQAAA